MAKLHEVSARYQLIHRLKAAVALLAFLVVVVAGMMAGLSVGTIMIRATIVLLCIFVISRVVIQIMVTHEEMNSGEG
ncbi:MAG: hypothetical protein KDD64_07395 [Bdellovibrionales bacterium]|nr:hypothetical protein [Bdellovibrionales bacterium]